MAKRKKPPEPTTEPTSRDLRNLRAFEMAAAGKTQSEIGEEIGLSRQRVNAILNSEESKRLTDVARSNLVNLQDVAVETLAEAMIMRASDMKTAVQAATTILKGLGVLTDKFEGNLTMKPFILKLLDGSEIHMGHKPEEKGD